MIVMSRSACYPCPVCHALICETDFCTRCGFEEEECMGPNGTTYEEQEQASMSKEKEIL